MNRKQKKRRESQKGTQSQSQHASIANLQAATAIKRGETKTDSSDDLDSREIPVILLLAFLGVVPLGAVLATNTQPFYEYVLNADKRVGIFSYASFWLSAAAALAAGRGVLRSKAAEAAVFKDSDYYWEGAIFIFAAAVCAALAVSDHPSTPTLFFWLLLALSVAQVCVSCIALSRQRGRTAEWRRAALLRVPLLLLLFGALAGYGYLTFTIAA
ncbi:hypothetical protein LMG26858_02324 [Achromobacter anxifer]|uniref:Uncharacterized protein n=1 Tax=Achromobacter anxifer TaxID=1287737 RepID=A0A6S7CSC7_9BURK|nr:hypothetical protein [Achromobacter anxifer]CAB3863081.1 hypothetical protein LMG26858_02324 [Achromobacter anxifer]